MYGLSPVSTEHYDYYVDEIRTIAGEYGVEPTVLPFIWRPLEMPMH